jgi:G patch domain-containing protein 1
MDDEDLGEFGIAPQKIQTKEDYSAGNNKRRYERPSEGPIPGEPVLKNLLKPSRDKAAARILISMGWKHNQGVGSRLTYREKKRANERNQRELYLQSKYGGTMIGSEDDDDDEDVLSDEDNITFAPDDFDPFIATIKTNTFGLGYSGLRPTVTQNFSLFEPTSLQIFDKNNRKLTIKGQAFGVGALEEEDDDIYANEDLSQYDKTLDERDPDASKNRKTLKNSEKVKKSTIEGFNSSSSADCSIKVFNVELSRNFVPRNWLKRRTRFEPIQKEKEKELQMSSKDKILGLGRHQLKPEDREKLLSDEKQPKSSNSNEGSLPVAKPKEDELLISAAVAKKFPELLDKKFINSDSSEKFKPFAMDSDKQARYEKFLSLNSSNDDEIKKLLNEIQPISMSSFNREMEKKEFIQAKKMYQPLDSLMGSRFVKESDLITEKKSFKKVIDGVEKIQVKRTRMMWKPLKELCKRFNVPEPFGGMMIDEDEDKAKIKKQSKSLFDYIGNPVNTKANFELPQVIPRNITEQKIEKKQITEQERESEIFNEIRKENAVKNFKKIFDEPVKQELPEPKTELERKVVESIEKKPEEKKELFKAIFCDSDDDDDDNEIEEKREENEKQLSNATKSNFIENFIETKTQVAFSRNDEVPQGIFKNIFEITQKPTTSTSLEQPKNSKENEIESKTSTIVASSSDSETELTKHLLEKLKQQSQGNKKKSKKRKKSSSTSSDEWVEKDKLKKKKKHKHPKKDSKKKKKHKSNK